MKKKIFRIVFSFLSAVIICFLVITGIQEYFSIDSIFDAISDHNKYEQKHSEKKTDTLDENQKSPDYINALPLSDRKYYIRNNEYTNDDILKPLTYYNKLILENNEAYLIKVYPDFVINKMLVNSKCDDVHQFTKSLNKAFINMFGEDFDFNNTLVNTTVLSRRDLVKMNIFFNDNYFVIDNNNLYFDSSIIDTGIIETMTEEAEKTTSFQNETTASTVSTQVSTLANSESFENNTLEEETTINQNHSITFNQFPFFYDNDDLEDNENIELPIKYAILVESLCTIKAKKNIEFNSETTIHSSKTTSEIINNSSKTETTKNTSSEAENETTTDEALSDEYTDYSETEYYIAYFFNGSWYLDYDFTTYLMYN